MAQPVSGILKVMRRDGGTYCHPATVPLQLDALALITLPSLLAYPCSFPCFFRGLLHKPCWWGGGGVKVCVLNTHTPSNVHAFSPEGKRLFLLIFFMLTRFKIIKEPNELPEHMNQYHQSYTDGIKQAKRARGKRGMRKG